ncbi:hypothetical protein [Paenibacillus sp. 23TSA30-6]|uniref:hypothetical protein n=1 Tax=Paenibacillus sp. 23TSA30-6 TaxID=2546104 RepID=UPI0017884858|nr:hypothetical protein [Paenibacillus sp. 23TSA30-6]MBE0338700.1 hypothetical protein [Paenibacillus sp. 23TSA30-6]
MTTNSLAIQFLKNNDLWPVFVNSSFGQDQSWSLHELQAARVQSNFRMYKSLASEYDHFIQGEYLDSILLVINGMDHQAFPSVEDPLLIAEARNRLETLLFGNHLITADCESGLNLLWCPPIPINLMELEGKQKEEIKQNIVHFFDKELGLMVSEVHFSSITDGTEWEEFFYERYFLPKKFMEITGLTHPVPSVPEVEKTILDYILEGKMEWLKSQVRKQLEQPLEFDVELSEPFTPSDSTALFMPFARAELAIPSDTTATAIINLVNQKFEVLECSEQDGCLTLLCMSPEGPYAETIAHIIINIRELLCPPFMHFFNNHDLELRSLSFILTETER